MYDIRNRTAYIAGSEVDKANNIHTDIKVNIDIPTVIPIVVYKDELIAKRNIVTTPHSQILDADVVNTITNVVDGIEQYTYIGYATSVVTNNGVRMYYDNINKDVIIIPDTELLVTDATLQKGKVYTISGYVLGSSIRNARDNMYTNLVGTVSKENANKEELPEFKNNLTTIKTHITKMQGIGINNNTSNNMLGVMITDNTYLERTNTDKAMIVELGTATDVLVDGNKKLPCYTLYQQSTSINTGNYCGIKTIPGSLKIGYVLDF